MFGINSWYLRIEPEKHKKNGYRKRLKIDKRSINLIIKYSFKSGNLEDNFSESAVSFISFHAVESVAKEN